MTDSFVQDPRKWLLETAYPLWIKNGIDQNEGGFFEALLPDGQPARLPLRAMVQARQIFSFRLAEKMGALSTAEAQTIIRRGTLYFIEKYSQPDGSIALTIGVDRKISDASAEFYTQSFAIFALSQAFSLCGDEVFKVRAFAILKYLQTKRRGPHGGFTEIKGGITVYQSNPHMHLLEGVLGWMQCDPDPIWRTTADEMVNLLKIQFIDADSGALGEHFSEDWKPIRTDGRFVFEPGHHFEWTWLLGVYQGLTGRTDLNPIRHRLFDLAMRYGIHPVRKVAVDEVWSDFRVKKGSSRFWPHCEQMKAAIQLATEAISANRPQYLAAADSAVAGLFKYIENAVPGLWLDTWTVTGDFVGNPVKASSLYHIAGGLYEYLETREKFMN